MKQLNKNAPRCLKLVTVSPKIRWKIERDNSSNFQDKIEDRNRWTSAFLLILQENVLQDLPSSNWIQHTFIYKPYRHCLQDGYSHDSYLQDGYIYEQFIQDG